jgi:putative phosphoesterase
MKEARQYKNISLYNGSGEFVAAGNRVALTHYPLKAKNLCLSGKYDFVFYGHTHKPWTETVGNCIMLNPGNVAGELFPPTFAVWETDNNKFDLIKVHGLE